jgi:hypothetical protein
MLAVKKGSDLANFWPPDPEPDDPRSLGEQINIPNFLYHATYKKLLKSIKLNGLGGIGSEKKKCEDSK